MWWGTCWWPRIFCPPTWRQRLRRRLSNASIRLLEATTHHANFFLTRDYLFYPISFYFYLFFFPVYLFIYFFFIARDMRNTGSKKTRRVEQSCARDRFKSQTERTPDAARHRSSAVGTRRTRNLIVFSVPAFAYTSCKISKYSNDTSPVVFVFVGGTISYQCTCGK